MKWFEKADNKEKIIHMFGGDLKIDEVYLYQVLCYDRTLTLLFFLFNIPDKTPKKWESKEFNAISVKLSFSDIKEMNISGVDFFNQKGRLDFCFIEDMVCVSFCGDNLELNCQSDGYFIGDITPEFINIAESMN